MLLLALLSHEPFVRTLSPLRWQGHELHVLLGAEKVLTEYGVDLLVSFFFSCRCFFFARLWVAQSKQVGPGASCCSEGPHPVGVRSGVRSGARLGVR